MLPPRAGCLPAIRTPCNPWGSRTAQRWPESVFGSKRTARRIYANACGRVRTWSELVLNGGWRRGRSQGLGRYALENACSVLLLSAKEDRKNQTKESSILDLVMEKGGSHDSEHIAKSDLFVPEAVRFSPQDRTHCPPSRARPNRQTVHRTPSVL